MHTKTLLTFVSLAVAALASPLKHCDNGAAVSDDQCCIWHEVRDELENELFSDEPCGKFVHESLRLTFHDAIAFSPLLESQGKFGGGGADGSIIQHADEEFKFSGNAGLREVVDKLKPIGDKFGVSYGDLIQFAGAVGITHCPGAPRLEFLAGRPKDSKPNPSASLIPDPADSVDKLIARLGDAGFSPNEMVDLLISHTIGGQEHVNPSIPHTPFDSTPETFDTQFFVETLLHGDVAPNGTLPAGEKPSPLKGEFRLQSDFAIARDPRTSCTWQSFINNQDLMMTRFRAAMSKLAVLGQTRSKLIDCSEVIPTPKTLAKKAFLPAGKNMTDVEAQCKATPFPSLTAQPGPQTSVHTEVLTLGALPTIV